MTSKIKLTYLLCLVLTIFSCSDDDDKNPADPDPFGACKLAELSYGVSEDEALLDGKEVFEWNGNQITKITFFDDAVEEGYILIHYADGKVSKVEEYEEGELDATRVYEYGSNGQWNKITETETGGDVTVITATYDGNLRTKAVFEYATDNGSETEIEEYTYSNGNLTKMVSTYTYEAADGSQSYTSTHTSTYEYNDMENKTAAILEFINSLFWAEATPSKNYETKRTTTSENSSESVNTTAYVFNEQGFPTKITSTYTVGENEPEVEVENFAWDCE